MNLLWNHRLDRGRTNLLLAIKLTTDYVVLPLRNFFQAQVAILHCTRARANDRE